MSIDESLLLSYLDGTISADDRQRVERVLAEQPALAEELALMARVEPKIVAYGSDRMAATAPLRKTVLDALHQEIHRAGAAALPASSLLTSSNVAIGTLVVALTAGGIWWTVSRYEPTTPTLPQPAVVTNDPRAQAAPALEQAQPQHVTSPAEQPQNVKALSNKPRIGRATVQQRTDAEAPTLDVRSTDDLRPPFGRGVDRQLRADADRSWEVDMDRSVASMEAAITREDFPTASRQAAQAATFAAYLGRKAESKKLWERALKYAERSNDAGLLRRLRRERDHTLSR
jgi:anti-sigma factor RsiW